jgi:hypothetical protein
MTVVITARLLVGIAVVMAATGAQAQSLADVARQEEARRGTFNTSAKVYTNSDLRSDFTKPPVTQSSPVVAAPPPPAPTASDAEPVQRPITQPGTEVERQAPSDKGEDYWRRRSAAIRSAIEEQQAQIVAIEQRLQSLLQSKTREDHRESELSSELVKKARVDLAYLQEEKTRFEAVAKANNVPDSWLR